MADRPHLLFNNPLEGTRTFRYRPRPVNPEDNTDDEPSYDPRVDTFRGSLNNLNTAIYRRHQERNPNLHVPVHFDYIDIEFFDVFKSNFEAHYRTRYGLLPVRKADFGRRILWAITNQGLFERFKENIQTFINREGHPNTDEFDNYIRFVKDFQLLTTADIIKIPQTRPLVHLSILQSPAIAIERIAAALLNYLREKEVEYVGLPANGTIELVEPDYNILIEIARNYDILQSVNAFEGGVIRPGLLSTPVREFGFTINPPSDDLPIIGIIDSGISNAGPLAPLIVNENGADYDITGTGALTDNEDHGTAVACLAALGEKPYQNDFSDSYDADARLLSIKILDPGKPYISEKRVADQIRRAHEERGIRIFVLTVGYTNNPKADNEHVSDYGALLDHLAFELDILIVISATNNNECINHDYPRVFSESHANIAPPADSYNNITVGSVAGNIINDAIFTEACIATSHNFPAFYTRKSHYDFDAPGIARTRVANSKFRKPDILYYGGDYSWHSNPLLRYSDNGQAGMKILSASPGNFYCIRLGTSLSAPLIANMAARVVKAYPELSMRSIKALLLNSSYIPNFSNHHEGFSSSMLNRIFGYGVPDLNKALNSSEKRVTMVLEDGIIPGAVKTYSLNLPAYVNEFEGSSPVLKFTLTLTFNFKPNHSSQLEYCPIHIGFGIFKNLPLAAGDGSEGIGNMKTSSMKFKNDSGWSQDAYNKKCLLTNTQSMTFSVRKSHIINEENTFKVAIASRFHPNLPTYLHTVYNEENVFSLVIRIEEVGSLAKLSGNLYEELEAVNTLEAITEIDVEAASDITLES